MPGLLALILLVVWVFAIVDVVGSDAADVRNLPKLVWLLLIVFLGPVGALVWFFLGRPNPPQIPTQQLPQMRNIPQRPQIRRNRRPAAPPVDVEAELRKQKEASEEWAKRRERHLREWEEQRRREESGPAAPTNDSADESS